MAFFNIEPLGNGVRTQYVLIVDTIQNRSYWKHVPGIEVARWACRRSAAFIKSDARGKVDDAYIDALDHSLMVDRGGGANLLQMTLRRTGEQWQEPAADEEGDIYIGDKPLFSILSDCGAVDLLRDIFGDTPDYSNNEGLYKYFDFAAKKYKEAEYTVEPYQTKEDALICAALNTPDCMDLEYVRAYVVSNESARIVSGGKPSSLISLATESKSPDGVLPHDVLSSAGYNGVPSYNKAAVKGFYYLPDEGTGMNYGAKMKHAAAKFDKN